jgi:hypothetical protein
MNLDGTSEIIVASSDANGTVRYLEANDLCVDKAVRNNLSVIYDVEYGLVGSEQSDGNGKATIVIASSEETGTIHTTEVNTINTTTALTDSVVQSGFGEVAAIKIADFYKTGVGVIEVFSKKGGVVVTHIMSESLADLRGSSSP